MCSFQHLFFVNNSESKGFNLTSRYIDDDVLSTKNPNFNNWIPLIYPKVFQIKETAKTACYDSVLDIYLQFDTNGQPESMTKEKTSMLPYQYVHTYGVYIYNDTIFWVLVYNYVI